MSKADDPGAPDATSPLPYRLPGPLQQRGELPIADNVPRVPRALRAFNGMPDERAQAETVAVKGKVRDPLTLRDLLEDPAMEEVGAGRFAGLRAAWGRLRRGADSRGAG